MKVVRNFVASFDDAASAGMYPYLSHDQIDALRAANKVLANLTPMKYLEERALYSSKFWRKEVEDWRRENKDVPLYVDSFIEGCK